MDSKNTISVRYIVKNMDATVDFYTKLLGFEIKMHPVPGFAALAKDNLTLFLNEPGIGGAGHAMPDGTLPEPGGWNRFQIAVSDLDTEVERLKTQGAHFKSDIITGKGGRQILLEDPSGNVIELFEYFKAE